ncbi:MAG TPA: hypothetical protein VGL76_06065 [Gaiellaceae bacterium]
MEISQSVTAEDLDLAPVFGELDDDARDGVLAALRDAEATLAKARDDLELTGDPLTLRLYPSGQTEIGSTLKGADGKLTFEASLRPRNFFSETPWQPGRPARMMLTDAWDVDGSVKVMVRRPVGKHKYTIEEMPEEIEEQRYESPIEAAGALKAIADQLATLARSRETTVDAWAPPLESAG